MMPPIRRRALLATPLLAAAGPCLAQGGAGQGGDPAARPVRLVLGFPPGSAADVAARVVSPALGAALGAPIVVENRPGAGSSIAADLVVRAAPDGGTLLLGSVANTINAGLQRDLTFDFARDLAPVVPLVTAPNILVVHPSVEARTVPELVAAARARPDGLFFGSSGIGTAPHLSGELFNLMAGVRMIHVPYPGSAQAVADLLAGRVAAMFSPASTVLAHVREGRLRSLASTGPARTAAAPDLPTMEEVGLAGFQSAVWFGLYAPAATPRPAIERVARAARAALDVPAARAALVAQGFDILDGTADALARLTAEETAKWARAIEASGARER